jgi:organic radical activating enzyme
MKYRLRSIFSSIQGEGRHTGRPATFIRFAGCNLNCPWCDTHKHTKEMMTLPEIMARVRKLGNRSIIVTGGEPTVVIGLRDVLEALKKEDYWLALETNGTRNIPEIELFDYVSVSPKYFYRARYSMETMVREADEVRIVAEDELMAGFCRQMRERIAARDYYISPLEEKGKIHYRRAFNLMLKLNAVPKTGGEAPWPPWMLSIQTHKVLGLK